MEKNLATALWQLMFRDKRQWELLPDWCAFLENKDLIAIQKDTWDQLLDFAWVSHTPHSFRQSVRNAFV